MGNWYSAVRPPSFVPLPSFLPASFFLSPVSNTHMLLSRNMLDCRLACCLLAQSPDIINSAPTKAPCYLLNIVHINISNLQHEKPNWQRFSFYITAEIDRHWTWKPWKHMERYNLIICTCLFLQTIRYVAANLARVDQSFLIGNYIPPKINISRC